MDRISAIHRVSHWFYLHHLNILAQLLRGGMRIIFSADVPPSMQIGKGTAFPHDALGCVFHPDVRIGMNCKILHGVTLGGRAGRTRVPVIGNDVLIGVHAQILGDVNIGNKAIIGAGAVVIADVPEKAIVVGCPAKVIGYNE